MTMETWRQREGVSFALLLLLLLSGHVYDIFRLGTLCFILRRPIDVLWPGAHGIVWIGGPRLLFYSCVFGQERFAGLRDCGD